MRYRRRRNKKTRIGFTFAAALTAILVLVTALDHAGALSPLDGIVYDSLLSLRSKIRPIRARVCIVYVSPDRDEIEFHSKLARRLNDLNARSIVYTDVHPPDNFVARSGISPKLLFRANGANDEQTPQTGSVTLLPTEFGIYRRHYGNREGFAPSLEWRVASRLLINESALPVDAYFDINFRGGPDSLPNVDAEKVVAGEITDRFFDGKVVLIGRRLGPNEVGLVTPTTQGLARMSRVEVHAHCLNTLLNEASICRLSRRSRALCYSICILLPFFIVQHSPVRRLWWNGLACLAIVFAVSWIELTVCNVRLPMAGMFISTLLVIFASLGIRFTSAKRTLEHFEIGKSAANSSTSEKEKFWASVGQLIYQYYYCHKLAILELPPNKNYLTVVHTTNCDESSIAEARRDFRRPPFRDAAELHSLLELDSARPFFTCPESDEAQVLVPLVVRGKVHGFMVASICANALEKPEFKDRLQSIGDDVAVAIEEFRIRTDDTPKTGGRIVIDPEQQQLARIQTNEQRNQDARRQLELVIESAATATATFDMFGHPLVVNRRMRELLKDTGVVVTNASLLETIHELSKLDWNECRRTLRTVMFGKSAETVVVPSHDPQDIAVLHIKPVLGPASSDTTAGADSSRNSFRGIQVEYSCENAWQSAIEDRHRIVRQLCDKMLATIESVRTIQSEPSDAKEIDDILESASTDLLACRQFLASHHEQSAKASLPVDITSVIELAIEGSRDDVETRGLRLENHGLNRKVDALANPQQCARLIDSLLAHVLQHAKTASAIVIAMDIDAHDITLTIENSSLKQYMESDGHAARLMPFLSEELLDFNRWVKAWGGKLEVLQVVGIGLQAQLRLKRHGWQIEASTPTTQSLN